MTSFKKLCGNCKHQSCCTNSAVPLVFSKDFEDLRSIGKSSKQYLKDKTINGKKVKAIKKKKNSDICTFWDENEQKCSIYQNRPFDCRAYPFDICRIGEKYHWIVYSCNPYSKWKWSEPYLQMLEKDKGFEEIMQNIEIFAGHTAMILPTESQKTPFIILREVRYTENIL